MWQGRTNKLVDSCYSFWQGAALAMVEMVKDGGGDTHDMDLYFKEISESDTAAYLRQLIEHHLS